MENGMEAIKPSEKINLIQPPNNNLPASLSEVIELTREKIRTIGNQGLVRWLLKAVKLLKIENERAPMHSETNDLKKLANGSITWIEYWLETGDVNIHVGQKRLELENNAKDLKDNMQYWKSSSRSPDPEMNPQLKTDLNKLISSAKHLTGTLKVLTNIFKIIENIVNVGNKSYFSENTNEHHTITAIKEYVAALNGETSVNSSASNRLQSTLVREKMTEWFLE
jgi:hypothetical protein